MAKIDKTTWEEMNKGKSTTEQVHRIVRHHQAMGIHNTGHLYLFSINVQQPQGCERLHIST